MSDHCPECRRRTIHRIGGEWCSYCRGWIHEVRLHHIESSNAVVRVLRTALLH